jgi:hypothetical protein
MTVAEFVKYVLDDGTEVFFESAESNLVSLHGGDADVTEGGRLTGRLQAVAAAAEEVSASLRSRLQPDEVTLEFGVKVSGEVNWWFFAKSQGEATINVTVKWSPNGTRTAGA